VLDIFHHVVRRLGVPADIEQLHDVAIGREKSQLLDLASEQRPIDAAAVKVELDGDLAAGRAIDAGPPRRTLRA
jgi:hypothetical protein